MNEEEYKKLSERYKNGERLSKEEYSEIISETLKKMSIKAQHKHMSGTIKWGTAGARAGYSGKNYYEEKMAENAGAKMKEPSFWEGEGISSTKEQQPKITTNFYQKYGILPTDDWDTIKGKLKQELRKWILRENATNDRQVLEEIEREQEEIHEALRLFNPKNAEKRKQYDEMIAEEQTAEIARDEEETKSTGLCRIPGTSSKKIGFASVERSVRNNPVGIQHLKEVQQEIADEVNNRDRQSKNIKEDELEK